MAVSLFYGMTESGKTSLAKVLVGEVKRAVIFDYNCNIEIKSAYIITDFSTQNILKVFSRFRDKLDFKIVCRPNRNDSDVNVFNKVAMLTIMLGRYQTKKGNTDRLIFLVDEADMICSSNYQSRELKYVVNVGRHDFVDTWFIARIPQRLHTDARSNATTAFIFKLIDDVALTNIRKSFGGKKTSDKVSTLMQYSFLVWKANGEIQIFDKNKKLLESWR
jgi:hypothetical protein